MYQTWFFSLIFIVWYVIIIVFINVSMCMCACVYFYVYVCMCVLGYVWRKYIFSLVASPREVLLLLVLLLLLFELNVYSLHAASISWYSITYIQMTHSLHFKKTSASINKLICISDVPVWMINKNLQKWLKKGMSHDQIFQ